MTEDYKLTDNAIAERVNGIIKTEKLYREPLCRSIGEARSVISDFISFYNEKRPHMSICFQTPSEVHGQTGTQVRAWRGWGALFFEICL